MLAAALLFGAGWGTHAWYRRHSDNHNVRRVALKGYRFTSPLLDVELPEGMNIRHEPIPFRHKIEAYIRRELDAGHLRNIAVYYRDLLDGPWFGINEKMEFNPASMMKVPLMIAWLKRAESDPKVLDRTYIFDDKKEIVPKGNFRPDGSIKPDRTYSVNELLKYMMNYSDNNATAVLYREMSTEELNAVMEGMDIDNIPNDHDNSISVHGYSGFFRILYNAAFLNRDMSEKALELLSLQDFPQGIASGVPEGITVAAKFGVTHDENGKGIQLHEFGIVYHPTQPYIIGIMTRGHDLDKQAEILRSISKMVYDSVDAAVMKRENR